MSLLKELFVSRVRVEMLSFFLRNPNQGFHVREITRRVKEQINAVRRELDRFLRIKLVEREQRGNRVFFRLRSDFPLLPELTGLFAKQEGLGTEIIKNHEKLGRVKFAVLSPAFIRGRVASLAEVDLLVVGKVSLPVLAAIVRQAEKDHGHEINYAAISEEEFAFRKKRRDPWMVNLLLGERIILLGNEEELTRFE